MQKSLLVVERFNSISGNLESYLALWNYLPEEKLKVEIKSRTWVTIKISRGKISAKLIIYFFFFSGLHAETVRAAIFQRLFFFQFFILATRINGTIQIIFHVIKIQFSYSFIISVRSLCGARVVLHNNKFFHSLSIHSSYKKSIECSQRGARKYF